MCVYLDDILVFYETEHQHLHDLHAVLKQLCCKNFYAKQHKFEFSKSSVKHLGQIVENSTIHINFDKVAAVLTWPVPTCVKKVQQFLGLANYYHDYAKNFTKLAASHSELWSPKMAWWWEQCKQSTFDKLK